MHNIQCVYQVLIPIITCLYYYIKKEKIETLSILKMAFNLFGGNKNNNNNNTITEEEEDISETKLINLNNSSNTTTKTKTKTKTTKKIDSLNTFSKDLLKRQNKEDVSKSISLTVETPRKIGTKQKSPPIIIVKKVTKNTPSSARKKQRQKRVKVTKAKKTSLPISKKSPQSKKAVSKRILPRKTALYHIRKLQNSSKSVFSKEPHWRIIKFITRNVMNRPDIKFEKAFKEKFIAIVEEKVVNDLTEAYLSALLCGNTQLKERHYLASEFKREHPNVMQWSTEEFEEHDKYIKATDFPNSRLCFDFKIQQSQI